MLIQVIKALKQKKKEYYGFESKILSTQLNTPFPVSISTIDLSVDTLFILSTLIPSIVNVWPLITTCPSPYALSKHE
jgi:hypothetical protein